MRKYQTAGAGLEEYEIGFWALRDIHAGEEVRTPALLAFLQKKLTVTPDSSVITTTSILSLHTNGLVTIRIRFWQR